MIVARYDGSSNGHATGDSKASATLSGPAGSDVSRPNGLRQDPEPNKSDPQSLSRPLAAESTYPRRSSISNLPGKSLPDAKDDLRVRDAGWPSRDGPPGSEDRQRSDYDRPVPRDNRGPPPDRAMPPRDQRIYERERDIDRDRERDRLRDRDWDRDRDRDRRYDWRRDDRRPADRRPPPEERHYEPRPGAERRWDPPVDSGRDKRADRPDERIPAGVRPANSADRFPADERPAPARTGPPVDMQSQRAPPDHEPRTDPPPSRDDRSVKPLGVPSLGENVRGPPVEEHPPPRSAVPLEERISRPPSLQDRISAAPAPPQRADERPARPVPTLEERLSHTSDDRASLSNVPRVRIGDDRSRIVEPTRPGPLADRDERPRMPTNAPVDRFPKNATDDRAAPPVSSRAATYTRAPSVTREEARPPPRAVSPLHPSARPPPPQPKHDYRPREPSRERGSDFRPYYRTEFDRPLEDDRRSENMDLEPGRYGDSRVPYRRYDWAPALTSPPRNDIYGSEAERRRTDYNREWYNARPPGWEDARAYWETKTHRPSGGEDWEREYSSRYGDHRGEPWDDRDRRYGETPAEPHARGGFEPRPLSTRLADSYPQDERSSYPPRPPFEASRVRPRSPSPVRGDRDRDELRPPLKRSREEGYGAPTLYDAPPGLGLSQDRSRGSPPPVPPGFGEVGGSRYYDNHGVDGERGYRDAYGSYDRGRRSPPSGSRAAYNGGGMGARSGSNERRYGMPPGGRSV